MKHYTVREGYTFVKDATVIGKELYLGANDNIENYKQVSDEALASDEEAAAESKEGATENQ